MRFSTAMLVLTFALFVDLTPTSVTQAADAYNRSAHSKALAYPFVGRKLPRPAPVADSIVTILEEANPHTDENDTNDSMAVLAQNYWAAGLQRVLAVRGLGPLANARELLHLRGIDMAVVNSDIVAYSRETGELPGLDARLSAVLKLYDKTIIIISQSNVASLQDLANQRVLALGADSDSHISARALFSMMKIPITIADTSFDDAVQQVVSGRAKALVTEVEHDDDSLAKLPAGKGLHVVPVPMTDALATVYRATPAPLQNAPALAAGGEVPTIKVASIIATFNWRPVHARYYAVSQFVRGLSQTIAMLRKQGVGHVWKEIDGREQIPGWTVFEPAGPVIANILPDASVQTPLPAEAPAAKPEPPSSPTAAPSASLPAPAVVESVAKVDISPKATPKLDEPTVVGLDIVVRPIAGLTDPGAPGGGLLAELVAAGLAGTPSHLTWTQTPDIDLTDEQRWTGARVGLGWARPACDAAGRLSQGEQMLCDRFLFSRPIFRALQVFFVRQGSDFAFDRDEQVIGHTVCAAAGTNTAALDTPKRGWLKQDLITLLHKPDLEQCLTALSRGAVDAVFADDLPGRAALENLNLADKIEAAGRPVAMLQLGVIALKSNPQAADMIARIDAGMAALQTDGRYSAIVLSQMQHPQSSTTVQAKR